MRPLRPLLVLWLGLASLFPVAAQQANQRSSVAELRRDAVELLKRAEANPPATSAFGEAIAQAADTIDRMAAGVSTPADQQALEQFRARSSGKRKAV